MLISVYQRPDDTEAICQGEILSCIRKIDLAQNSFLSDETFELDPTTYDFGIVLTADCDLTQDFGIRQWRAGKAPQPESISEANWQHNLLSSILIAPVYTAAEFKPWVTKHWAQIRQNSHSRYEFLSDISAGEDLSNEGIPSLVVDFRQYFSLPAEELYEVVRANRTKRRSKLSSPFLQHLITRFGQHLSRVALEIEHGTLSTFCEIGQFEELTKENMTDEDLMSLEEAVEELGG